MGKVNLSSPWVQLYNQICAMFKNDKEVKVLFDEESHDISLYVDNDEKEEAIGYFLNQKRIYGNTSVTVRVIPSNNHGPKSVSLKDILCAAFSGNPSFSFAESYDTPFGNHTFCVFKNEVIQYWCDNMFDLNGVKSTLMEDIAREVFNPEVLIYELHFCTEMPESAGKPLGEWP